MCGVCVGNLVTVQHLLQVTHVRLVLGRRRWPFLIEDAMRPILDIEATCLAQYHRRYGAHGEIVRALSIRFNPAEGVRTQQNQH